MKRGGHSAAILSDRNASRGYANVALVIAATALLLLATAGSARASEGVPLELTKFKMETLKETKETIEEGGKYLGFIDVPDDFAQAGGHPWALKTTFEFSSETTALEGGELVTVPTRDPKDVIVNLPPGLLGDPLAVPRCPLTQALLSTKECPATTQVGEARVRFYGGQKFARGPVYDLTPEDGQSAEFGIKVGGLTFVLTGHVVRTTSGYGISVLTNEIPTTSEVVASEVTFWGVPADPSHDSQRGMVCGAVPADKGHESCSGGEIASPLPSRAFLTMPANCAAGPIGATANVDSWEEPGEFRNLSVEEPLPTGSAGSSVGVVGCNRLSFEPSIEVSPDTTEADEPVGLGVNVRVPQNEAPSSPATPEVRDSTVTLPAGLSISPGIVDGIEACDESGPNGINFSGPESETLGPDGELQLAAGHCPDASIVGTVEAETPLLPAPVKGHIYLARPLCGGVDQLPCTEHDAVEGRLYEIYMELGGTGSLADAGVNLKIRGQVEPNPATGQLTAVFKDTPQFPFSELRVRLNGGPRAALDTPAACGLATTVARFEPWSAPGVTPGGTFVAGTPDATPASTFEVSGCPALQTLAPGFSGGTVKPRAGQFSPFTLVLTRKDREPYIAGVQVHPPQGLLGLLSGVPLCGEPQAEAGTCSGASRIGSTMVASGAGSHPFEIGGDVYLTTGYRGAPFGLSIVTHVIAGPFNLGIVVVRARIDVDPSTSKLTVTSDPLPQIVFGVPLRLQRISVNIDRPGFMFNPTNCQSQQLSATIAGTAGTLVSVSNPFAVSDCKSLDFKPRFTVATNGHTSRSNGASLDAKVSFPKVPFGSQANVAQVRVSLPRRLPSRLTTLQQACPSATFSSNAAACPKASIVGVARTKSPVLPVELEGPVYFVSHGGQAFPSLIVVLQGDGVRVDLTGTTFINSKTGITSNTFATVPDVPVESFELYLPQGNNSALAANGDLCGTERVSVTKRVKADTKTRSVHFTARRQVKLIMPTEFIAQNGLVLKQATKIAINGCKTAGRLGK
jgi:hypothetical protein